MVLLVGPALVVSTYFFIIATWSNCFLFIGYVNMIFFRTQAMSLYSVFWLFTGLFADQMIVVDYRANN